MRFKETGKNVSAFATLLALCCFSFAACGNSSPDPGFEEGRWYTVGAADAAVFDGNRWVAGPTQIGPDVVAPLRYRRVGNVVGLHGSIHYATGPALTVMTQVFTLPADFLPSSVQTSSLLLVNGSTDVTSTADPGGNLLSIHTDGTVWIGGTSAAVTDGYVNDAGGPVEWITTN